MPLPLVWLDGRLLPLAEARISPLDRGFLFGDGAYEVLPVYGGRAYRLDAHLERLDRSLREIRMPPPLDRAGWLAALGKLSAGLAHELRNPLNVIKTSVYYLLNARHPTAEKTAEHLNRIHKQVGLADGVITALSSFARLPLPNLEPFDLKTMIEEALETCSLPPGPPAARWRTICATHWGRSSASPSWM